MAVMTTDSKLTRASCWWGRNNYLALRAICREIYHESTPIFYGRSTFEVAHGLNRDFIVPLPPGMPFHLFRSISLAYPEGFGRCF
ncbi:hypothetical protein CC78DRAFT_161670 [Lojkania enalia]|uniref:Uncharacterized protein n=1 Tax=Lojkania enalia TaxID=147567 RepID=A0A9P4KEH7_9PLEO|nr:hypothetical protein CC78DRAFT_161670 [Didymosphaeria enalia]